ncbi:DUF1292 domain-containing protein [uncultured Traorella sp.]|jgi:uncharacterized protein YrzB (UPF0473 family)|uniref:DUF1292 domain-containing protein n=1 Tax=uncultured Traorella sp. TaxID=1929048 RepID=UPI0025DCB2E1|nr:DUF1292 domain-containing protein [uncultured Traorella sp.]
MLDSNTLYVKDDNGKEVAMEILFTFANEEMGKQYVVFVDPNDDSGEVFASCYDDEGNLLPIETESEWEMVEEVLGAFNEEEL